MIGPASPIDGGGSGEWVVASARVAASVRGREGRVRVACNQMISSPGVGRAVSLFADVALNSVASDYLADALILAVV